MQNPTTTPPPRESHTSLNRPRNESRPPNADLKDDTNTIRTHVTSILAANRTVVAIAHSYGGQVASNALAGLSVSRIIYMTAFALPEHVSMVDVVKAHGHGDLIPLAFLFDEDRSVVSADPKTLLVGGEPGEELDTYVGSFVRWNGECMYQGAEKAAWREVPVTYLYATKDMTVPLDYQKDMVRDMEKAGCEVQTFELETGHCPNFTATEGVVEAVKKAVGV